jgi:NADPH:quinone reductase-like Zn-dependent oxidoreductase
VKGFGAHAEFVCIRESAALAHQPAGMTFEEAAAVCDGAILALSCLRPADQALTWLRPADLRKGQRILSTAHLDPWALQGCS